MDEWKQGLIEYICLGCNKTIAKEKGEIRLENGCKLFIYCGDCAKKINKK